MMVLVINSTSAIHPAVNGSFVISQDKTNVSNVPIMRQVIALAKCLLLRIITFSIDICFSKYNKISTIKNYSSIGEKMYFCS